jgi:hypothetical protein
MTRCRTLAGEPLDLWLDALVSGLVEPAAESFALLAAAAGAALVGVVARRAAARSGGTEAQRLLAIGEESEDARDTVLQLADTNADAFARFLGLLRGTIEPDAERTERLSALRDALEATIDGQLRPRGVSTTAGRATLWGSTTTPTTNLNNRLWPKFATVSPGQTPIIEAYVAEHEIGHNLGAVQDSPPHSSGPTTTAPTEHRRQRLAHQGGLTTASGPAASSTARRRRVPTRSATTAQSRATAIPISAPPIASVAQCTPR